MRVLITGVAGFLGSHLADLLISQGHEVVGVDSFITGKMENTAQLKDHPRYSFIRHDAVEPLKLAGPLDRIYHLASPCSTASYTRHQLAMLRTNSQGTWTLLELALEKNARFLMASSSEVYGDARFHPQREDYWGNVNPVGLRSMYDEAKRFAEACTMAYQRARNADTRIIRIFNTYGPRMDVHDGRFVINFISQALANEPLTVFGDGQQTRSLCYVSDMVRGISLAMECDFHEPINLGNPEEAMVLEIAREIRDLVPGCRSEIVHQPMPPDDPRQRCPDITRARQICHWTPQVSRREGLGKMIQHYREHVST